MDSYSFMQVMHWCLVLMLVVTPDFIIVSEPVGGLNLTVVPTGAACPPKAPPAGAPNADPAAPKVGVCCAVPNSPAALLVTVGAPKSPPAEVAAGAPKPVPV